ncbi:MAG: hypothetical protein KF746_20975 [Chitinophagaceae bacterium]|nr:hypothetical protein [Chitinophagaceae bacterium]
MSKSRKYSTKDPEVKSKNDFISSDFEMQNDISKEIIRRLRIQNKKLLHQIEALKAKLKIECSNTDQVNKRLSYAMVVNNRLSEALGSCNKCWGEDHNCTSCYGKGASGWRPINKRFFYLYILPSIENFNGDSK